MAFLFALTSLRISSFNVHTKLSLREIHTFRDKVEEHYSEKVTN